MGYNNLGLSRNEIESDAMLFYKFADSFSTFEVYEQCNNMLYINKLNKETLKMETLVCPTCGCSLVRLGITKENVVIRKYQEKEYPFCCDGCAVLFEENPDALLKEVNSLVVCPSCLAEKPINQTVAINYKGGKLHFCKCPHCLTVFQEDPEYYIKRLSGEIEFAGVFSGERGCCT